MYKIIYKYVHQSRQYNGMKYYAHVIHCKAVQTISAFPVTK